MENPLLVLQEILMKTQHVHHAAIIDIRSNMLDYKDIASFEYAFKNPMLVREKGLEYNKLTYSVTRAEPDTVYAKMDKKGIIMVKTNTFMIIATYTDNMYPSVCIEAVERMADYLKRKNK